MVPLNTLVDTLPATPTPPGATPAETDATSDLLAEAAFTARPVTVGVATPMSGTITLVASVMLARSGVLARPPCATVSVSVADFASALTVASSR